MTIEYTLKFYDYWHVSSGLSAGARLDSTVIKDANAIPYVAGKIIKGLTKEMAETLNQSSFIDQCFGIEGEKMGECFFTNATLKDATAKHILDNSLQENLFDIIASTKIDANGVAEENTLREIEVVIPLELTGAIQNVPDHYMEPMKRSLSMIKRLGLNRNRGLGRCEFIAQEIQ